MYDSPRFSASAFVASTSNPRTGNPASSNRRTSGSPTYPNPMTPMRAVRSRMAVSSAGSESLASCDGCIVVLRHLAGAIVRFVPPHKRSHPFFDRGLRPKSHRLSEIGYIGHRRGNIARLHRQQIERGLATQFGLEHGNTVHQLDRLVVPDVENAIGRTAPGRIGIAACPLRIAGRHGVENADDAFDDVIDIGEVADHLSFV